jgi:outer membrane protein
VKPYLAFNLMAGVPAKPKLTATGTLSPYGTLGHVLYGPVVLSAQYQEKRLGRFQPYVGGGVVYAMIFKDYDATIHSLKVKNHLGSAVLGGADYMFTPKWGAFVEGEQLWLAVNARGNIAGVVPATAHVQLNPTKVAVGVKYCF